MITVVDAENFEKQLICDELVEEEDKQGGSSGRRRGGRVKRKEEINA